MRARFLNFECVDAHARTSSGPMRFPVIKINHICQASDFIPKIFRFFFTARRKIADFGVGGGLLQIFNFYFCNFFPIFVLHLFCIYGNKNLFLSYTVRKFLIKLVIILCNMCKFFIMCALL